MEFIVLFAVLFVSAMCILLLITGAFMRGGRADDDR